MSRDGILGLPDDGIDFREWWQEITGRRPGSSLVERLELAIAAGTLGSPTAGTEAPWNEVAKFFGRPGDTEALGRAVFCAHLAATKPGDISRLLSLCERVSWPTDDIVRIGKLDHGQWPVGIARAMDESPQGSLLRPVDGSFSPAMAFDLVTRFWAQCDGFRSWSRLPLGSRSLVALFADCRLEEIGSGNVQYVQDHVLATLKLELLPQGSGRIFPDPASLLFVSQDDSFRSATEAARESARELLGAIPEDLDVRWSLTRHDRLPLSRLSQGSAGAAFALGLTALWALTPNTRLTRKVRALDLSKVGVTARLKEETPGSWRLAEVADIQEKLREAARQSDRVRVVCVARGQTRGTIPSLRVLEADTLRELITALGKELKMVQDRRNPWRYWGIVALCLVIAGAYNWERRRQAEWLFGLRDKALFAITPNRYSKDMITRAFTRLSKDTLSDALVLIHDRDFAAALQVLEKAKAEGLGTRPLYHSLMGDLYYHQNQFDAAVPFYRQAISLAGQEDTDAKADLALSLQRSRSDAAEKIEEALRIHREVIATLEAALRDKSGLVWNRTRLLEKWACAHHNVAGLLIDRPRFKLRSVQAAFESLEKARTVFTRDDYEEAWAGITGTLGVAYQNRRDGNRTENLKYSIQYLNGAKDVFRRHGRSLRVGHYTYLIGYAKSQLRSGDRARNIEEALALYDEAEEILRSLKTYYPAQLARVQRMRALAFLDRRLGDRGSNLKQAATLLEGALSEFERLGERIDAAKTMDDLARALLLYSRDGSDGNAEKAIGYLRSAAKVFEEKIFPTEAAQVLNDLGAAHREHSNGRSWTSLEKSRECYERAISLRTGSGRSDQLAVVKNGLGLTLLAMRHRGGDAVILESIGWFHEAMGEPGLSKEEAPEIVSAASVGLGDAWSALRGGDRKANRAMASENYRVAEQYLGSIAAYSNEHRYVLARLEVLECEREAMGTQHTVEEATSGVRRQRAARAGARGSM